MSAPATLPAIIATAAEYVDQTLTHLPGGRIWRRAAGTFFGILTAFADEWTRIHNRGVDIMAELDPAQTSELLGEWEASYGLPDPGAPPATSDAERRQNLIAAMIRRGGATPAYFEGLAEVLLGANVNIVEAPLQNVFRAGVGRAGDRLGAWDAQFYWTIEAPAAASAGQRARLEAMINRFKPQHTIALFEYTL